MTDRDPPSFIREAKKEPWACTNRLRCWAVVSLILLGSEFRADLE